MLGPTIKFYLRFWTEMFTWKPNHKREDIKIGVKGICVDWIVSLRIAFRVVGVYQYGNETFLNVGNLLLLCA
jgi:hypothetical protein